MEVAASLAGAAIALSFISELMRLRRWRHEIAPAAPWTDTRCTARCRAAQTITGLLMAAAIITFLTQANGPLWALSTVIVAVLPGTLAVGIHNARVIDDTARRLTAGSVRAAA